MQEYSNIPTASEIEEFVASLMEDLNRMAWKYRERQEEREDLVSVALVEIMEAIRFKGLLEKEDPRVFAFKLAKFAMMGEHSRGHSDILGRPARTDRAPVDLTPVLSLDMPLSPDSDMSLMDLLPDSSPSRSVVSRRVRSLNAAIRRLGKRQRAALRRHVGLEGYGKHTGAEVARILKITEGRVGNYAREARRALQSDAELCAVVGVDVVGVKKQVRRRLSSLARSYRLGRMLRQRQALAVTEVQG